MFIFYTPQFTATSEFMFDEYPSHFFVSFPRCKKILQKFDKILTPFVKDVKVLEPKGMKVSFAEQSLYDTIAQVTGLNSILGFSANCYYRMRLTDRAAAHTVFSENDPCDFVHQINQRGALQLSC